MYGLLLIRAFVVSPKKADFKKGQWETYSKQEEWWTDRECASEGVEIEYAVVVVFFVVVKEWEDPQ